MAHWTPAQLALLNNLSLDSDQVIAGLQALPPEASIGSTGGIMASPLPITHTQVIGLPDMSQTYPADVAEPQPPGDENWVRTQHGGVWGWIIEGRMDTWTPDNGNDADGADLRDGGSLAGGAIVPVLPAVGILSRLAAPLAGTIRSVIQRFAQGSVIRWNQLPGWAQSALQAAGVTAGADILQDVPGVPGESFILGAFQGGDGGPSFGPGGPGMGASIVGSWVANGVTFYRLADGRLAVQNKKGRWKVWRPKRPIVLMPTGAGDLRTLLRADAVLNRQAKRIAAMLNRRAGGTRKRRSPTPQGVTVVAQDGSKVTQI